MGEQPESNVKLPAYQETSAELLNWWGQVIFLHLLEECSIHHFGFSPSKFRKTWLSLEWKSSQYSSFVSFGLSKFWLLWWEWRHNKVSEMPSLSSLIYFLSLSIIFSYPLPILHQPMFLELPVSAEHASRFWGYWSWRVPSLRKSQPPGLEYHASYLRR